MDQEQLVSATNDSRRLPPEFKTLLNIVHVLIEHGYILSDPTNTVLGKTGEGRLDQRNPRCFVTEEDPTDRPGRIQTLLCLVGAAPPRRRVVTMQIMMRNAQNAVVDVYDPRDSEKASHMGRLLAQELRITVTPVPKSDKPLTKTISIYPAPS